MSIFYKVLKLSKQIGAALLKSKEPQELEKTEIFREEDKTYILNTLKDKNQVKQRQELKKEVNKNKKKDWENVEGRITLPKRKAYWHYAAAAVITGVLVTTYFFNTNNTLDPTENHTIVNTIQQGTDKAVLTLEDGSQVVLEKGEAFQNQNANSNGEQITYDKNENDTNAQLVYNYLTIPRGGQFFITLSDETKVWLNSDTQLKFPVNFVKNKPRQVELVYGEAYFDVSHNGSAFHVINKNHNIEVLGTEFNVKAYDEDAFIETTLVDGKVNVAVNGLSEILKPNQQSSFKKETNTMDVSQVDVAEFISWKNGLFTFNEENLEEIVKTLSRWYDTDYIFQASQSKSFQFTGVLERTEDIQGVLKLIQETSEGEVTFEITNKTIIIK